jgi:ferritin-like protein
MTSPDITTQNVIDDLDSFYCHNIVASLWADAVANRLEGMAIYLLSDELPEVAEHARAAARRLADRIGDLGGAVTADPRELIDRAPGGAEFSIPTARTRGPSSATRCTAWTSSSPPTRGSWTRCGDGTT